MNFIRIFCAAQIGNANPNEMKNDNVDPEKMFGIVLCSLLKTLNYVSLSNWVVASMTLKLSILWLTLREA